MTDPVEAQYEAYPYPERNPEEEKERLITGSPSHPFEIDHFLFGGARDWSRPFRALVAGGGTGDGLIMLAQILADHGAEAEIVYLDLSKASRAIAEQRAQIRGLENIRFVTGDLLSAPDLGPFDYIDCCGVLHHLPDPDAGFAALRRALAPDGGIGAMVYAPYGRAGVYEMQAVLRALVGNDPPAQQIDFAKRVLNTLPPTAALVRNPFVHDHIQGGDAGLYDLLLHGRDRAYDVDQLCDALERADLSLTSFAVPGRYEPKLLLLDKELRTRADALPGRLRAATAERLAGNLKVHVFYAVPRGTEAGRVAKPKPDAVPKLLNVSGAALSQSIWKNGYFSGSLEGLTFRRNLRKDAAGLPAAIDGKRSLAEIRAMLGWNRALFDEVFGEFYPPLNNFNLLRFSKLGVGK